MDIKRFSDRSPGMLLAAVLILFMGACKKNNGSGSSGQNLKGFFSSSGQYTLFNRALGKTHLDGLLGGANPYTVFAPDDSAMSRAGYDAAGIDSADIGTLTGILLYHMVPGAIASTDVELYQETLLTTADSSYPAYLEYNNFGVFYNGIPIVSVDNRLVNGLVQGIHSMALPPSGDVAATIAKIPGLSDFSYVVKNAKSLINLGQGYNVVIPYLSGTPTSPMTVFLPDNKDFVAAGLDSYTAILGSYGPPSGFMTQGQYFTSDFLGKNIVNEYYGINPTGNQMWFSDDGYSFFSASPPAIYGHYRIVQSNIVATNGVIHVIEPY